MARKSVIDLEGLGPRVLMMAANGMGSRRIAEALGKQGVKISHVAVAKYLENNTENRQEATEQVKSAVQAELQKQALSDVQMLEKLRDEIAKVVFDEPPPVISLVGVVVDPETGQPVVDRSLWLKATKELRDTLQARLKVAGAGGDDEVKVKVDLL